MLPPAMIAAASRSVPVSTLSLPALPFELSRYEMNFNDEAADFDRKHLNNAWALGRIEHERSPFLEPVVAQKMVDLYHDRRGILWSHGGYLEDRTELWRGGYLKEPVIHGGIDVTLPAGTVVRCMRDGTVVWVDDDKNPDGGWGPYIVVRTKNDAGAIEYVLYGHLGNMFVQVGDEVSRGGVIADIGSPPHNGGWWSHLHLQCIAQEYYEWCCDNDINKTLDGYFPCSQLDLFRVRFPDPSALLWDATDDVAGGSVRSGLGMAQ